MVSFLDPDDKGITANFGGPTKEAYLTFTDKDGLNLLFFWENFDIPLELVPLEMSKIILTFFKAIEMSQTQTEYSETDHELESYSMMIHSLREIQMWPDFKQFHAQLKAELLRDIFKLGKTAFRVAFAKGPFSPTCRNALRRISN